MSSAGNVAISTTHLPHSDPREWRRIGLDEAMSLIPESDLDLTGCDQPGSCGLPPPVVITLARRPDRWVAAQHRLRERGMQRIIKAVAEDGQLLPPPLLNSLMVDPGAVDSPPAHYLQMTRPVVGCFISHLTIWKRFLQSSARHVLILEDDAFLASEFTAETGRELMANIPADADMALLGCTIMDGLAEPSPHRQLTRVYYYNGTYGYILTRKGCLNLLPWLLPIETHIDNQISLALVRNRRSMQVYCAKPRCIEHDFTVYSDVYIPVDDAARADRQLDVIFKASRVTLLREGAKLFNMHMV